MMSGGLPDNQNDPKQAWLGTVLELRKELKFEPRCQAGSSFVLVEDPVRNKFFQIGEREYAVAATLDGTLSVDEIVQRLGDVEEDFVVRVTQWLVQGNLAYVVGSDSSKRINTQVANAEKAKLIGKLNPVSFKVKLFNPTKVLDASVPFAKWIFSKAFFAIWCVIGILALQTIHGSWDQMGAASAGILSGGRWVWMIVLWLILKVVHEGAHGVACRKYGGEVPEAGVLILLFTPMPYVNVTSMWRFANRWQRIVVCAAGMYVELFVSFVAILVWKHCDAMVSSLAFDLFIMASVTTILFNANPLMRFDGYFILADVLGIPNLYPKGTKWVGDRLKALVLGTPKTPNLIPSGEFWQAAIYGSMAFVWKILVSVSLTIGASVLFPNFGIFFAIIGSVFWVLMPLYQQYRQTLGAAARHPVNRIRVVISGAVIATAIVLLFGFFRGPATKSAPAIVQFADETIVRTEASGFVEEIHVTSGQTVEAGQLLVRLRNRALEDEVTALDCKVNESKIQVRIYQQTGESGLARSEEETLAGLVRQLKDKREQARALEIHAPFAGVVFQRQLESLQGRFVDKGDTVLTLARKDTKEIVVLIDQRDLESVKENREQTVRVMIRGMPIFDSNLMDSQINPRASTATSYPSLCAHAGGMLEVKPVSDPGSGEESGFELLDPRFTARLPIGPDVGTSLHSGQRGWAYIKSPQQSMGGYLYIEACDWLKKKIELATQAALMQ